MSQLRRGALEFCVLALLRHDPSYGYELVQALGEVDGLVASEGTIYPLPTRLRREQLVTTFWQESEEGPPRRYYQLTAAGERALADFAVDWSRFRDGVDALLTSSGAGDDTMNTDPIVTDYLDRLEAAAAGLPPDQRIELVTDVRGHIDSALRAARASDEVTVRNVLERLGRPEDIVREAGQPADEQPDVAPSTDGRDTAALVILSVGFLIAFLGVVLRGTTLLGPIEIGALAAWAIVAGYVTWRAVTRAPRRDRGGSLEIAAIVLLTAGGLVWIIWAWVAGYVLVWLSDVWKTRDKVVVAVVAVLLMPLGWRMTSPWFGTDLQLKGAFTFALGAGGLLAGAYLSWRLVQVSRHASTRRPQRRSWLVAAAAAVVLVGAVVAASAVGGSGTEEGCAADACGPDTTVDQFERVGLDADRQDVAHTLGPPDRRESRWRWGPGVHPQAVQTQVPPAQSQYDDCWMYDLHGADDGLAHGTICFVADTVVYAGIEPAD